jgi:hypothetical protein
MKEHIYNMTQGMLKKSKSAEHAYEGDYKICWQEAKVLQTEPNTTYRKCKQAANMVLADHPVSRTSMDIYPIWTPIITAEINKL